MNRVERRVAPSPFFVAMHEFPDRIPDPACLGVYRDIRSLDPGEFSDLLTHDLANLLSSGSGYVSHFIEGGSEIASNIRTLFLDVVRKNSEESIKRSTIKTGDGTQVSIAATEPQNPTGITVNDDVLAAMERWIQKIPDLLPIAQDKLALLHTPPDRLEGPQLNMLPYIVKKVPETLESTPVFKRIYPVFTASLRFLATPNPHDFHVLEERHITLTELGRYFHVPVTPSPTTTRWLTGFETITLFNLVQNAIKFQEEWNKGRKELPVVISAENDGAISINNRSITRIAPTARVFDVGVKGSNGNTGYGLAIANFYALLAGKELSFTSTEDGATSHRIAFRLKDKKAEPAVVPQHELIFDVAALHTSMNVPVR